ncbi:hypothetical protein P4534_21355 [Peribacillus butanolivorans]|uniref:hypothetical protein n=1 Tax=Peribacillus butanolivorans TaxID=421767 RepID=UPI002E23AE21|nr:hypothetical protein [Peribacillus butanolivorans]
MKMDFLEPCLLEDFKQVISDNEDFLYLKYGNNDGKNKFNCVFSARDWIHVVVNGIPSIDLKHKNQDVLSLNMIQFIGAIDILVESVQQIHRVLNNNKNYPLLKDNTTFKKSISDDDYFSHIRAAFGTHPVNLVSKNGIESKKRYFASWSSSSGNGIFSVYLYSNDPNEKNEELTIDCKELISYCQKRYEHLSELINIITKQASQSKSEQSKILITKKEKPLEQLCVLKEENKKRFGDDGYKSEIEELIELYSAPKKFEFRNEIIKKYLDQIRPCIDEIFENLQSMNIVDLKMYPTPQYNSVPNLRKFSYYIQKIYEHIVRKDVWTQREMIPSFIEELKENKILPYFVTIDIDIRDLRLILNAMLFNNGAKLANDYYVKKEESQAVIIVDDVLDV